jgi:transposase
MTPGLRSSPTLPRSKPGKPRVDDPRAISGILHVLKTGCRWRDCPSKYGPHTTIYNRATTGGRSAASGSGSSRRWRRQDQCLKSFASIPVTSKRTARPLAQKGSTWKRLGPRAAEGQAKSMLADDRGRQVAFALTPGNVADITRPFRSSAPWTSPNACLPIRPMMATVFVTGSSGPHPR